MRVIGIYSGNMAELKKYKFFMKEKFLSTRTKIYKVPLIFINKIFSIIQFLILINPVT